MEHDFFLNSPRRQRAMETRARLVAAATELFDTQGYQQTTVAQIVRRASVAKGTFFTHFATKDAVMAEFLRKRMDSVLRVREGLALAHPVDRIRAMLRVLAVVSSTSSPMTCAMITAALSNPEIRSMTQSLHRAVMDFIVQDLREAQAAREMTVDTPPETIAEVLTRSCLGVALSFVLVPGKAPLLETLEPVLDAYLANFGAVVHAVEDSCSIG